MKTRPATEDCVTVIDCHYVYEKTAAAFLLNAGNEAAFIETNTSHALPYLLTALKDKNISAEKIKYIIITHVHLDHAGGTAALLQHCPNATVVAHPRAARHVIDPQRLVESARMVYGHELFEKLYGAIERVPAERVITPEDGASLTLGDRELRFFYTRGHANHHFVIFDTQDRTVYTGDSFGIAYPLLQSGSRPFIYPTTTPTDFDPIEAHRSYDLITSLKPRRAMLTHFGEWGDVSYGAAELHRLMNEIEKIYGYLLEHDLSQEKATTYAEEQFEALFLRELAERGIYPTEEQLQMLRIDTGINAQGIVFSAMRQKKKNER